MIRKLLPLFFALSLPMGTATAHPAAPPGAAALVGGGIRAHVDFGRFELGFGIGRSCSPRYYSAPYRPAYRLERSFVPPLYDTRVVGYDCWGRPIWQRVCVRAGYFRSVRVPVYGCLWVLRPRPFLFARRATSCSP